MLEHLPDRLKGEFLQAMIDTQPDTQLLRDALLRGETINGAKLERGSHIRIDLLQPSLWLTKSSGVRYSQVSIPNIDQERNEVHL